MANLSEQADMDDTTCEITRCPGEAVERGWCHKHYLRWYRNGDPLALMRPPETGGIYQITGPGGRVYIGSSDNLRRRWKSHKAQLRRGEHHNCHLQADWISEGEAAFTFAVLEEISDVTLLVAAEQRYLDEALEADVPYNIAMDIRCPARGIPHTEEAKRKIGAKAKAWLDQPENLEHVRARTQGEGNPMGKLSEAQVLAICDRLLDGAHPAQVAADLGVVQETVYQIRSGRTWKHIVSPETVAAMMAVRQNPNAGRVVDDKRRALGSAVGLSNRGRKLPAERVAQISAQSRGAGNPKAKLTEAHVREIKRRLAIGERNKDLAALFGIHPNSIAKIKAGETWSHVTI